MNIEQDYIMKLIKEMVKVIWTILSGKKKSEEINDQIENTSIDGIRSLAIRLADKGEINEAENLLFNKIDRSDINHLYVVL